jgi:hypothetical protein
VFFGGVNRLVLGQLGVHQIWNDQNDLVSGQAKLADVLEAFRDFGVSREIESIMLRTPPERMHMFTSEEVERYAVNTGDVFGGLAQGNDADADASAAPPSTEAADTLTEPEYVARAWFTTSERGTDAQSVTWGTVHWRESRSGEGDLLVNGAVSIAGLSTVSLTIMPNLDEGLAATHVIELNVGDWPSDSPQPRLVSMKTRWSALYPGDDLSGAVARASGSTFLFALDNSATTKSSNLVALAGARFIEARFAGSSATTTMTLEIDVTARRLFDKALVAWDGKEAERAIASAVAERERFVAEEAGRREAEARRVAEEAAAAEAAEVTEQERPIVLQPGFSLHPPANFF